MLNEYLDNQDDRQDRDNSGSLVGGLAINLFEWQTFGMVQKFSKTGRLYMPMTGYLNNRMGYGFDMMGRGVEKGAWGGLRSTSKIGASILGLSRLAGAVNIAGSMIDPIWGFASALGNPEMLLVAAAWFGGIAMIRNAAKAMQKHQYVDMGNSFEDNGATYTSRQRAVRAISESHLQARSAIGSEAMLFHHSGG